METTAEVISVSKHTNSDGDTSYRMYVSYNVDGQMYNSSYSTSSYISEGSFINPKKYYLSLENIEEKE